MRGQRIREVYPSVSAIIVERVVDKKDRSQTVVDDDPDWTVVGVYEVVGNYHSAEADCLICGRV